MKQVKKNNLTLPASALPLNYNSSRPKEVASAEDFYHEEEERMECALGLQLSLHPLRGQFLSHGSPGAEGTTIAHMPGQRRSKERGGWLPAASSINLQDWENVQN